ncbi:isocitrate dehydrogenase [NAD] subunit gamma, mitochondrial [Nasonia vitripennis]|uniref:Isopropylmalate dehydrogenase-like domain-containing protein n=1 Tax=Nasonia vitripennis TaxID=7425 RepID=A0A7M7G4S7_NASVI|nr:isocitrate dehydrogenase [NAD] subunit gamma, mitochondrial [Nasonia vitripennis]XP_008208140.1 isocitrate dehydrogenase [NAD] subunit gamma, mitochondrial [Nasonia vitripennis]XP_016836790.1 isocitrate dehydrogenase [NAD] subunit gamma, mitochondrial [Nasonia vitripennis]XP_031780258.1 isocitrate dehydrogenase [NAD] subunit gamma, mitochondrial [Nasonia vitripennis]
MAFVRALNCVKRVKIPEGTICRHASTTNPAMHYQFEPLRRNTSTPQVYYGGRHTVTLLPGAGVGPELMEYVKEIFKFTGVPVDFEEIEIDGNSTNDDLEYAIMSIRRNGIALKGNIEAYHPDKQQEVVSGNVTLRKELDLYVNAAHCVSYDGVRSRHRNVDIVIIRQNVDGEYAMMEHEAVEGVVESMKIITRPNAERIVRYAFEYARRHNRKKITTVHKANIMKLSDGLFLTVAREIARDYPDIIHNDMIVDNTCMQLVANPHQFDMILTTNLYGSVISNVLCGLLGGAGLTSGKNIGEHYVIFESATRNTGAGIAGKNIANPVAMLNASVDMLRHLNRQRHAGLISNAIVGSIRGGVRTQDLGGTATSREVVDDILRRIDIAATNGN